MIAVESYWWSRPSQVCGKGGNFFVFLGQESVLFMELWRTGIVVLFLFVMLLFFFSISFVYIELCLRTANAIAHCTQIDKSLCCILQNMSSKRDLQKIAPYCKICYYLIFIKNIFLPLSWFIRLGIYVVCFKSNPHM